MCGRWDVSFLKCYTVRLLGITKKFYNRRRKITWCSRMYTHIYICMFRNPKYLTPRGTSSVRCWSWMRICVYPFCKFNRHWDEVYIRDNFNLKYLNYCPIRKWAPFMRNTRIIMHSIISSSCSRFTLNNVETVFRVAWSYLPYSN